MGREAHKRRGCFWQLFTYGVAAACYAVVLGASFAGALYTLTASGEIVTVPEVVGKLRPEIEAQLPAGLTLRVIDEACSLPAGTIISQNLPPGRTVKLPHQLEVRVSQGSDQRPVPDLINLPLEYALEQLERDGLRAGTVQEAEIDNSPVLDGAILETRPPAGTMLPVGGKVDLTVRREARELLAQVPDLVGRRLSEMQSLADGLGLRVDRVDRRLDYNHPAGTVIEQSPVPGTPLTEGMLLHLVVADDGSGMPAAAAGRAAVAVAPRAVPLYFVVPPGVGNYDVHVTLSDANGDREVFRDSCEPGRRLLLNLAVNGSGYAYIYVGGELNKVVPL